MQRVNFQSWPNQTQIERASNYLIESNCFGFFDGGCLIFAQAIKLLIPKLQIATILNKKRPDHYGVFIPNTLWGDASGLYDNKYYWVQKFAKLENVYGKLDIKEKFVFSECIPQNIDLSKKIAKILSS